MHATRSNLMELAPAHGRLHIGICDPCSTGIVDLRADGRVKDKLVRDTNL